MKMEEIEDFFNLKKHNTSPSKLIEYLITKIYVLRNEKVFRFNKYRIKYLFERQESDCLIIVFTAFTRVGIKARYNYRRALKKYKCNKLFILDDFGFDKRGAFYLGENKDLTISFGVKKLIEDKIAELKCSKRIYLGSSKGGYCALYFGMDDDDGIIMVGSPQYYIGNFLKSFQKTMSYIMGDYSKESVDYLNSLLPNKIKSKKNSNIKVYLHSSKNEHTFKEHIQGLINDIRKNNIALETEILNYNNHSDVGKYFPPFFMKKIDNILGK